MHDFDEDEFNQLIQGDEKIEQLRDKLFNEDFLEQFVPNREKFEQLKKTAEELVPDDLSDENINDFQNLVSDFISEMNESITPEQIAAFGGLMQEYYEPEDISEILAEYDPNIRDDADREFVNALKEWILSQFEKITEDDVYAMSIFYHLGFLEDMTPVGDLSFAHNTEQYYNENLGSFDERWNFVDWKEHHQEAFDDEKLKKWLAAKGYDMEEDDETISNEIFDLSVIAVSELHGENAVSDRFGRKIPIIMTDYDYYYKTAVRAVKANGAELFDEEFFDYCGCNYSG